VFDLNIYHSLVLVIVKYNGDEPPKNYTNRCNHHSFSYMFHVKAHHTFQAQISRHFTLDMILLYIPFRRYLISAERLLKSVLPFTFKEQK